MPRGLDYRFSPDSLPEEIRSAPRWVCWRGVAREKGGITKPPLRPQEKEAAAACNDPSTWGTLEDAVRSAQANAWGIGFMLGDGFVGVDLDHCVDPNTGEPQPWAAKIVRDLDSYTEFSPSGTGLHILLAGRIPEEAGDRRRKGPVEVYDGGRYFTVTGRAYGPHRPLLRPVGLALVELVQSLGEPQDGPSTAPQERPSAPSASSSVGKAALTDGDEELLFQLKTGNPRAYRLYAQGWEGMDFASQSEADLSLCNSLVNAGADDPAQVDRIFRTSRLMRGKWDQKRGAQTYGQNTVARAFDGKWTQKRAPATPAKPTGEEETQRRFSPKARKRMDEYASLFASISPYVSRDGALYQVKTDKSGLEIPHPLANFTCVLKRETCYDDGTERAICFELEGVNDRGEILPCVEVGSQSFGNMNWVLKLWGARANVKPGPQIKDTLRHAIQCTGRSAQRREVFTHTGWRVIDGTACYLYSGGAIGKDGVEVDLRKGGNLADYYSFTQARHDPQEAARASKALLDAFPARISYSLLAAMYLAPLRDPLERAGFPPSFLLFLYGGTGTGKTTTAALFLTHFGENFTNRHLPASFEGTANALREKAHAAKDVPFLVDDLHPAADLRTRKELENKVQALTRSFGDNAERARLNANAEARPEKPPRGLGMISGEDLPGIGQSGSARFYLLEFHPEDVFGNGGRARMSELQQRGAEGVYAAAMRGFIESIQRKAQNEQGLQKLGQALASRARALRQELSEALPRAHARAPEAAAFLLLGLEAAVRHWQELGVCGPQEGEEILAQGRRVLLENAREQAEITRAEEPVSLFFDVLRELLAAHEISFYGQDSDAALTPLHPVGKIDANYVHLMPNVAYNAVSEALRKQGRTFSLTKDALGKLLRDADILQADSRGCATRKERVNGKPLPVWSIRRAYWDQEGEQTRLKEVSET